MLDSGDLDPIIAYLKKCASSGVATVARKLPLRKEEMLSAIAGEEEGETSDTDGQPLRKFVAPPERPFTETLGDVNAILDELKKILQTDEERLIAQECFINETPPRELVEDYAHLFPGVDKEAKLKYLNQVLKRIRLRAEKSPTFQNLRIARRKNDGRAFLTYSVSDVSEVGEAMMPGSEPCAFDEATLLEYIQGKASAEIGAAIERSPACVEAARRFAAEVEILTPLFRLSLCPDVETLLDYHAKRLPSAQQLVVHKHLQGCRQCQAEIAMFEAIDAVPLRAEASFFRRLIEAVLTVPTLALSPVRGAILQYQTPTIYMQIGELLVNYAIARRQEGDYHQAAALLDDAEQVWYKLANPLWLAMVTVERIALALDREDYPTAQRLVRQAPPLTDALRLQAEFNLLQADLGRITANNATAVNAAHQAYVDACTYATAYGERWIEQRALVGLGKLWLIADPVRAVAFFEQAADIDTAMRQTLTVEELKASFHEQANDLFDDLISLAIERNQGWQALGYIWRAKADALLDLLQAVQEQAGSTPTHVAAIDHKRQQIATLRWQLATQADPALPPLLKEQSNTLIAGLEQQLLDLRRRRNHVPDGPRPPFVLTETGDPAARVAQMEADLLFEYVRCGDELWGVIANRHGACTGIQLIDVETIADLNARLQLRFGNVVAQPNAQRVQSNDIWLAECLPLLAKCYQSLVAPLVAKIPAASVASIVIAPCEPLFLLPFAAFWDGRQFWGEQHQIEMIPSGALLGRAASGASVLSPPLIIAASAGSMTAVRTEANCIAETLPASVVFIDTPALTYLRALQAPPQILHIAAHSLLRADAPLFTGLQLSGEVLTVEQSYELPLRGTELVTLSGCTTASGQESESALLAFQAAFLLAGAQRVLTTLWPIADDAATRWMAHFYRYLATGLAVPQALQRTQQSCLADPALRHPALWAPFTSTRG